MGRTPSSRWIRKDGSGKGKGEGKGKVDMYTHTQVKSRIHGIHADYVGKVIKLLLWKPC